MMKALSKSPHQEFSSNVAVARSACSHWSLRRSADQGEHSDLLRAGRPGVGWVVMEIVRVRHVRGFMEPQTSVLYKLSALEIAITKLLRSVPLKF